MLLPFWITVIPIEERLRGWFRDALGA